jgi:hypothetical protein
VTQAALELETWDQKTHRLALELRKLTESRPDATTPAFTKWAKRYRELDYELTLHLEAVPDDI